MHKDLEVIANLEFGKAVERISQEVREKMLHAVAGKARGGPMEATRLHFQLSQSEQMAQEYVRIWQDLLETKNGGYLTRENVIFILQKVQQIIATRKASLMNGPDHVRLGSAGGEITRRMQSIVASINRDLEIRIRKQQAFPRKEAMSEKEHVTVNIQNAANVNLGSQVGTINARLNAISDQSEGHHEVATALKELSEALIKNGQIGDSQKEEALQVISEIAKQAEARPEARSLGTLKAMVVGLHSAVSVSSDLAILWDRYAPALKHFFGI
jgi:hypothetical protein